METAAGRHWWERSPFTIAFEQMAHRPPLPRRWLVYCALAYLVPIVALEALPENGGTFREVSWLITLAPAFILSLHYGMLGALAGLIAGTVMFVMVQVVLDVNLVQVNRDVLLPIYVSYGMLAIAVGWLSQQLHEDYRRLLEAERLAALGEAADALRHELDNALRAITAEAGVLRSSGRLSAQDTDGVDTILDMARRIQRDVQQLAALTDVTSTPYLGEQKMVRAESVPPSAAPTG
jgi:signal transduction histidine kinase